MRICLQGDPPTCFLFTESLVREAEGCFSLNSVPQPSYNHPQPPALLGLWQIQPSPPLLVSRALAWQLVCSWGVGEAVDVAAGHRPSTFLGFFSQGNPEPGFVKNRARGTTPYAILHNPWPGGLIFLLTAPLVPLVHARLHGLGDRR